ncbi:MAG: SRPBCC family protein [Glaciimonas sp.]|nr:SRPBCC family protein [Glaciimonas sp.]
MYQFSIVALCQFTSVGDSRQQTPLRINAHYSVGAKPEQLFSVLGDLEGITRFFPMIHHATVEHTADCAGEGSLRVCSIRGMGKVNEEIVWWSEPNGYAYRANGLLVPLRDHLGVILISDDGSGGAILEWRQYFNTRYGLLGWMFPVMMRFLMDRAIRNLAKLLGTLSSPVNTSVVR